MYVTVDPDGEPVVALAEPEDCKRFHVAVRGGADAGAVDGALRAAGAGQLDGDGEALVLVAAVRAMADGRVGASWDADFAAMLDYAGAKGWVSEDGASIRAHVERG